MNFFNDLYEFLTKIDSNSGRKRYQIWLQSDPAKKCVMYARNNIKKILSITFIAIVLFILAINTLIKYSYVMQNIKHSGIKTISEMTRIHANDIYLADHIINDFIKNYPNCVKAWTSFQIRFENASTFEAFSKKHTDNIEIIYSSRSDNLNHKQVEKRMILSDIEDCKTFRRILTNSNIDKDEKTILIKNYNKSEQEKCSFTSSFIQSHETKDNQYIVILIYKSKDNFNSVLYGGFFTFDNKENEESFILEVIQKLRVIFDVKNN